MASRYIQLQQQRVDLSKKSAALLEDPTATAEQAEAVTNEIKAVDAELEKFKALHEAERSAPAFAAPPLIATPLVEQDPKRGFRTIGEFAGAVAQACKRDGTAKIDDRLKVTMYDDGVRIGAAAPSTLQQEGHSTEGFQIPPDFRPGIWRPAFENDELLSLIGPQPTESNSVQFVRDETTPWGAAGIVAYWVAQGAQLTASKLGTQGTELKLHKVAAIVYATDEVLADAALLGSRINEAAPQAIAWTVSESFMRGTGAGQPLGWGHASYTGRVSVAKETSQAAATILPENLFKMHSRLLTGPGSKVIWLANRDTLPQVGLLKIGNEPSWTAQNMGLKDAPSGLLIGDAIRFTEHCDTLGTNGDIQLVNVAGYAAYIKSGGTRFDSSIHLYFDYDIMAFRWIMRIGGMPLLSAPVNPFKGNKTKSHFVWLDTRS